MLLKRAAHPIALTAILLLQLACQLLPPSPQRVGEHFLVAFVRDGLNDIAVTWSATGQSWNNGRFPATPTSTTPPARASVPFNGVGASADTTGILYSVFFDQPSGYVDVAGLGPAIWDATGAKYNLGTSVLSAPATIDLGGRNRLIAVRQAGAQLGVYYVPSNGRTITPVSVPGATLVEGRPALVRRNDGEVLLAWREANSFKILTVTGRSNASGGFTFDPAHAWSFSAVSDPAVAADSRYFYLGIVEVVPPSWRKNIYRSPDAVQWSVFGTTPGSPNANTLLGLAALSNGSLLEASLTENRRYRAAEVFLCARTTVTQPCTWAQINQADVFKGGGCFQGICSDSNWITVGTAGFPHKERGASPRGESEPTSRQKPSRHVTERQMVSQCIVS